MAGIIISKQERTAKSGNRFAFCQLSDASGVFEVTLFQETLAQARELLVAGKAVLLSVDVQANGPELRLTCHEVKPLEEVVAAVAEGIRIVLHSTAPVPALKEIIEQLGRGKARIGLTIETAPFQEVDIDLPTTYALPPKARTALKALVGVEVHEL